MLRTLVTLGLIVCLVCVLKVAIREGGGPVGSKESFSLDSMVPPIQPSPQELLRPYPTAKATSDPRIIRSPYKENTFLDISRFVPGQLVRCQQTNLPFYVPHSSGIDYGMIVGQWQLEIMSTEAQRRYRIQFHADLDRIIGSGELTHEDNHLIEQLFRTRIELQGLFRENELLATFTEYDGEHQVLRSGKFRWYFSSSKGSLAGVMIDSERDEYLANAQRRITNTEMIPSHGDNAMDFVPKDWRLVDSIDGPLPSVGHYLAIVIEPEDRAIEDRWLLLAHCMSGSLFNVVFISDHAIEPRRASPDDTFRGLFQSPPNDKGEPKSGLFAVRHDNASYGVRSGSDFWFQFHADRQQWLLVEGRSYQFDLSITDGLTLSRHQPGIELQRFNIHHLPPVTGKDSHLPNGLFSKSEL